MEYAKDEVFHIQYEEEIKKNRTSLKSIILFLTILVFSFCIINFILIYNFINLLAIL